MELKSSRIKSATYNDSTEVLSITFSSGAIYKYFGVPEEIYNALIKSDSPGRFFEATIKPKYKCKKV